MIQDILKDKEKLTAVEEKIAHYLLKEQEQIKEQTAHYIAKQLYIHPSMITRFCQKIGYMGFNDFKDAYIDELNHLHSYFVSIDPNYPFTIHDKNMVTAFKIGKLYQEIIDDTLSLLKHDDLQNIINLMKKSQTIYLYSAGVQADLAMTFKSKMLKIGKNVIVETRMNEMFYRASFCQQNSLFVVISYSGEIEQELRGVKKLKENHIPVLAITSYGKSSLSQLADYRLFVSTREKLVNNLGDFSMNLSVLLLLDILYANIFNEDYAHHYENKITTTKGFEIYRKSKNSLLNDKNKD